MFRPLRASWFTPRPVTRAPPKERAFESYGAQGRMLVRLEGKATRGNGGGKKELARRADVGFRPCCTILTHIAAPLSFVLGPPDPLTAQGVQLRARYGPRGADVLPRTPVTSKMITTLQRGIGRRSPPTCMPLRRFRLPRRRRPIRLPLGPFDVQHFAQVPPPMLL